MKNTKLTEAWLFIFMIIVNIGFSQSQETPWFIESTFPSDIFAPHLVGINMPQPTGSPSNWISPTSQQQFYNFPLLINSIGPALLRCSDNQFTSMGWGRGIFLRSGAALVWGDTTYFDNATHADNWLFMTYPSLNPIGDAATGLIPRQTTAAGIATVAPDYISKIYGQTRAGEPFQGTYQFYKGVIAGSGNQRLESDAMVRNDNYYQSVLLGFQNTTTFSNNDGIVVAEGNNTLARSGIMSKRIRLTGDPSQLLTGTGTWVKPWLLDGNSGTMDDIHLLGNFLGTKDGVALSFRVNNQRAGRVEFTGPWCTSFGYQALNIYNTGGYNSAFGFKALFNNTDGSWNTAIGNMALLENTLGGDNTAIGDEAMMHNIEGNLNTAVGEGALFHNTMGNENTASGFMTLSNNTIGSWNTAVGYQALGTNATGNNNTALGYIAGNFGSLPAGFNNTFLGYSTGAIGDVPFHNSTALGSNAHFMSNNTMILGDNSVYVGIGLSDVATPPGNKLEINFHDGDHLSDLDDMTFPGSGLRFRDLTSRSTPVMNVEKVLSVNTDGDVILATVTPGGSGVYSMCPGSQDPTINLDNNNLYVYLSQGTTPDINNTVNNVMIGQPCGTQTRGRLDVRRPMSPAGGSTGIYSLNTDPGKSQYSHPSDYLNMSYPFSPSVAVYGFTNAPDPNLLLDPFRTNIGGLFMSSGSIINIGVYGSARQPFGGANGGPTGACYGGYFSPRGLNNNTIGENLYGIYACETNPNNTNNWTYAGYFDGDVNIMGTCTATFFITSDSTIKTNVTDIHNALATISSIEPRSFYYKTSEYPSLNLQEGQQFGFIAQEVEQVLPDVVRGFGVPERKDSTGNIIAEALHLKSLNYQSLIPFAIAGIQELDSMVTHLSLISIKTSAPLSKNFLIKSTGVDSIGISQIYDNGACVGIGTDSVPEGYKMVIEGKLGARDVLVNCIPPDYPAKGTKGTNPSSWPDYVFDSKFILTPIEELESYVSANRHLPGIPSQNDIEKAGGILLGEMATRQMEKIEELYKYIIEMNKTMTKLSAENNELKDRLNRLENK